MTQLRKFNSQFILQLDVRFALLLVAVPWRRLATRALLPRCSLRSEIAPCCSVFLFLCARVCNCWQISAVSLVLMHLMHPGLFCVRRETRDSLELDATQQEGMHYAFRARGSKFSVKQLLFKGCKFQVLCLWEGLWMSDVLISRINELI